MAAAGAGSAVTTGPALSAGEVPVRLENLNHFFGRGDLRKQVLFDLNRLAAAGVARAPRIAAVVLAAGQSKRELHSFCSEGKSCSLGGRCRLSSTRTPSAPSKP